MRYRPFARTGMAVSALSLSLSGEGDERDAADWRDLVHAAFEAGINAFELSQPSPALLAGFAEGASAVKRSLIFVSLRLAAGLAPAAVWACAEEVIAGAALQDLNLVTVEAGSGLSPNLLEVLRQLTDARLAHRLAIAGACDEVSEHVMSGAFDALVTSFNLLSGWRERHLIRTALERQMGVIGCEPCPQDVADLAETARAEAKPGWFKQVHPLAGSGTYAFLKTTHGWTSEQLCLGYALTEPALASVQASVTGPEHLADLASVTDRDLPAAVSAQIEMARFSAERESGVERRSERRSA